MIILFVYRVFARTVFVFLGILPSCRHTISCSTYAEHMISKHGTIGGLARAAVRVTQCHPWSRG